MKKVNIYLFSTLLAFLLLFACQSQLAGQDNLTCHECQLRLNENIAQTNPSHLAHTLVFSGMTFVALMLLAWSFHLQRRNTAKQQEIINLKMMNNRNLIRPHFVFNVLNHVSMQQGSEADHTIQDIIRLMRSQLAVSSQPYVTLREELTFTENYIQLASKNLHGDFVFHIEHQDEEILDTRKIPSTFIQILAENAIKHALAPLEGAKRLTIKISARENETVVVVEDNGPGFDIRHNFNGTGTGLKVIQHTITLYNHSHRHKMTLKVENINDAHGHPAGCKAMLTIPQDVGL